MIFAGSGLALGVFRVKHRPKAIAGTEECVNAVACPNMVVNILNYTHLHFNIHFNR